MSLAIVVEIYRAFRQIPCIDLRILINQLQSTLLYSQSTPPWTRLGIRIWILKQVQDDDQENKNRKEVIHRQLPLPMPCYDFVLVTEFALGPHKERFRAPPASLTWRAVSTRLENVFTAAWWSAITSDSSFVGSNCRPQSELRPVLMGLAPPYGLATHCTGHCSACVARGIKRPCWFDVIPAFLPLYAGSRLRHI